MNAEIIAIGSELLLGQIVDTNSAWIAGCLAENGIELVRTSTVGDDFGRMESVLKEAIARSSIIITTGGLGPTEDDLTREVIAEATGHPLVLNPQLLEQIEAHFKRRGYRMTENNRKQANIPQGAIPVENPKGTAPAFIVEGTNYVVISLPGVPLEMKYLMENSGIPYLRRRFNIKGQIIQYRVLRTCGLGESAVGLQIADLMRQSKNPTVGTLASPGDVRIRITAQADHSEEASSMIRNMEIEIRSRIGKLIYGVDNETLHGNLSKTLQSMNLSLAVVETFTGGLVSQKLTSEDTPSSLGGLVLPSESSQREFLGFGPAEFRTLSQNLKELTNALANQGQRFFKTDLGLALYTKGIDKMKEGEYHAEACFSLSASQTTESQQYPLGGELPMLRERATIIALDMLRKYLLEQDAPSV
jgi:nicotinamide-nucleotide amidase